MAVEVLKIKNLFWSNKSWEVPNSPPSFENATRLEKTPVIDSVEDVAGWIVLEGKDWNYLRYKGIFYFLRRFKCLSPKSERYKFILIKDHWCNLLANGVFYILGTVCVFNDDKTLEANLDKCKPSLFTPCLLSFCRFQEEKYNWKKHCKKKEIKEKFKQKILTRKNFEWFKNRLFFEPLRKFNESKGVINQTNEIYIFGYLPTSETSNGWKEKLKRKINNFLNDLSDKAIIKVESNDRGISGKFAISYDSDSGKTSIGKTVVEAVEIYNIDLSDCYDIEPIDRVTLKEFTGERLLHVLDETRGLFDVADDIEHPNNDLLIKLSRKAYLPIKSVKNNFWNGNILQPNNTGGTYWKQEELVDLYSEKPQRITLKDREVGFLWYLDQINFQLVGIKKEGKVHILNANQNYYPDQWNKSIPVIHKTKPLPYGFLMFQIVREFANWKVFEYTGSAPLKSFFYYSGFNSNFKDFYNSSGKWWSNIGWRLQQIAGSPTFSKMHLDLFWFSWLYFAPSQDPNWSSIVPGSYHYEDGWDHWATVGLAYYTTYAVNHPVWSMRNPFVSQENARIHYIANEQKLDTMTIKTKVALNENRPIEKGDWFFSSLEYRWTEFSLQKWHDYPAIKQITSSTLKTAERVAEGFLTLGITELTRYLEDSNDNKPTIAYSMSALHDLTTNENEYHLTNHLNNKVVICSNLNGEIELRWFEKLSFKHSLDESYDQIVADVDGATEKALDYYHIRTVGTVIRNNTLSREQINELLFLFYAGANYSVQINAERTTARFTWFTDEELESPTSDQLFDLKGTDWMAYLKGGDIHLIAKDDSLFKPKETSISTITPSENLKDISLAEKINQKNILTIFTKEWDLFTKFKFSSNNPDEFNVYIEAKKPKNDRSKFDFYHIHAQEQEDFIDEWIQVPQKNLTFTAPLEQASFDRLKLAIDRSREDYLLNKEKHALSHEMHRHEYEKLLWELEVKSNEMHANLGIATGSAITGVFAQGGFRYAAGVFALNMAKNAYFSFMRQSKMRSNVDKEEAFGMRSLVLSEYTLDNNFRNQQLSSLIALNELSNRYERPEINDTDLMLEYNEKNNLGRAYIRTFTPTKRQLESLNAHKEEYGVTCYIPNILFEIRSGMPENVVQFCDFEEKGGIVGEYIQDPIERDVLLARLENGLKIVDVNKVLNIEVDFDITPPKQVDEKEYVEKIKALNSLNLDLRHIETLQTTKIEKLEQTIKTMAELAEKTRIENEKKIKEIEKQLEEEKNKPKIDPETIEALNKCKSDLEASNQHLRNAAKDAHDKAEEIKGLIAKKEDLEGKLTEANNETAKANKKVEELTTKKEELEGQLLEATNELAKAREEHGEGKEDLEKKLKEAEDKVADLTTKGAQCQRDLLAANRSLASFRKTLNDTEKRLQVANNQVGLYRQEAENCKKSIAQKTAALASVNKILDDLAQGKKITITKGTFTAETNIDEDKLEEINTQLESNNQSLAKCVEDKEKLEKDLEEKDEEIKRLKEELEEEKKKKATAVEIPEIQLMGYTPSQMEHYKDCIINEIYQRIFKIWAGLIVSRDPYTNEIYYTDRNYNYEASGISPVVEELDKRIKNNSSPYFNTLVRVRELLKNLERYSNTQMDKTIIRGYLNRCISGPTDFGKLVTEQIKTKLKSCFYPTPEEYERLYKGLNQEAWEKEFNISNKWRLSNEAFKPMLFSIAIMYATANNSNNSEESRRRAVAILRMIVEDYHTGKKIKTPSGLNISSYWKDLLQPQLDYLTKNSQTMFQYIRDTWQTNATGSAANATKPTRDAFTKLATKMIEFWPTGFDSKILKAYGTLCRDFLTKFIAVGGKGLDPWKEYRDRLPEMQARQGTYQLKTN